MALIEPAREAAAGNRSAADAVGPGTACLARPARRAVFFDKDGTLVENVPYNVDPERVRLARGADEALRLLAGQGFAIVVVTNQRGIADGRFDAAALAASTARLHELVAAAGARLDAVYVCPHHPQARLPAYRCQCRCRKPNPGMLQKAAGELGIELARSWMIGDILDDVEAGRAAGCATILLDPGGETEWRMSPRRMPDFRARDLADAVRTLLGAPTGNAARGGRPGARAADPASRAAEGA